MDTSSASSSWGQIIKLRIHSFLAVEGKTEEVAHLVLQISNAACIQKCRSEHFCLKLTATAPAPGQSPIVQFASYDEKRKRWSSSLESGGWKYSQIWEAVSTNGNPDSAFLQRVMDAVSHHWANRQEQNWTEYWWWTQVLRLALPPALHLLLQGLNLCLLTANDLALAAPLLEPLSIWMCAEDDE